ncbi:DUF3667 domain-containing protein [Fibrella aquatilis]|uniref:DUF3667 domain-containing protein n=1 Tax=Fibrella aquatilis TaxID=2817059 RepID=A0A939G864_9BACT|nr:DUF3667 domain-containing protein [Fibrella aquatilis]MBO0931563.1 DUF3667 domain-containing protein [Fibrella aquatilis]
MLSEPVTDVHNHHATGQITCRNCANPFEGHFCNQCGQSAHTHAVNWHYIWHEVPHSVWHLDRGILFTLRELCTRPGHTVREFLAGKRVKHYRPLALLLILGAVVVFVTHSLHVNIAQDTQKLLSPASATKSGRLQAFQKEASQFVERNRTLVQIALIPIYALGFWIMFRRRGYNYPELLVTQTFVANFALLFSLIPVLMYWAMGSSMAVYSSSMSLSLLVMMGYNMIVHTQLYQGKLPTRTIVWRSAAAYLLGYGLFILLVMLITLVYIIVSR